jgi:hypothetical protein
MDDTYMPEARRLSERLHDLVMRDRSVRVSCGWCRGKGKPFAGNGPRLVSIKVLDSDMGFPFEVDLREAKCEMNLSSGGVAAVAQHLGSDDRS